jgi:hypothetical protein
MEDRSVDPRSLCSRSVRGNMIIIDFHNPNANLIPRFSSNIRALDHNNVILYTFLEQVLKLCMIIFRFEP